VKIDEMLDERQQLTLTIKESTATRKDLDRSIVEEIQKDISFEREATHEYVTDGYVVRAKTAMTRTIDEEALREFQKRHDGVELPIKRQHVIDMTRLHSFAEEHPKLYHQFCYVITSKPRAVALTIKESK